jgi:hypothetical protein
MSRKQNKSKKFGSKKPRIIGVTKVTEHHPCVDPMESREAAWLFLDAFSFENTPAKTPSRQST